MPSIWLTQAANRSVNVIKTLPSRLVHFSYPAVKNAPNTSNIQNHSIYTYFNAFLKKRKTEMQRKYPCKIYVNFTWSHIFQKMAYYFGETARRLSKEGTRETRAGIPFLIQPKDSRTFSKFWNLVRRVPQG
jgi:hypothetical protein